MQLNRTGKDARSPGVVAMLARRVATSMAPDRATARLWEKSRDNRGHAA
jgi:hypothetical protein